eukprot:768436-Hanusia_phi.AAC.3
MQGTKRASHGLDFEGSRTFWWDEGLRNKYTHRRISQSSHVGHAEGSAVDSENSFPSSPQAGRDSPDTSSLATDRRMAPGPSLHPADLMSSSGVSMDGRGNIFIVDLCSHGIRKITPRGVVSVLANKISPVLRGFCCFHPRSSLLARRCSLALLASLARALRAAGGSADEKDRLPHRSELFDDPGYEKKMFFSAMAARREEGGVGGFGGETWTHLPDVLRLGAVRGSRLLVSLNPAGNELEGERVSSLACSSSAPLASQTL